MPQAILGDQEIVVLSFCIAVPPKAVLCFYRLGAFRAALVARYKACRPSADFACPVSYENSRILGSDPPAAVMLTG